jgi:hypothetical protein
MKAIRKLLTSRASFCAWLALGLVGARLLFFDNIFFAPQAIPNHDMSQGLGFFATSMHSVRLSGEIAWWNPVGHSGYAQYFQSFLSPLAPTPHHVVFIAWAQLIRGLSWLGVALPEYYQYLIVNYVILPWLAYWVFGLFASQLFRARATVAFLALGYALSGIGLWHTAWFYFQEPFSLFLFLAASLQVLRRPTAGNYLLFLAAGLIQATSVNYWTLYNLFFVGIVLGSYAVIYPTRIRRLGRRIRMMVSRRRGTALAIGTAALATLAVWGVLVGSIMAEQNANYVRPYGKFSAQETGRRAAEIRRYSTEIFEPYVQRSSQELNVHNARYLGAVLLPLLVLAGCRRWRRRERWLLLMGLGVLIVCLAPPFLLALVHWIPGLERVRHLCYFYTHYWQIALLLLSGTTLDDLLLGRWSLACRRRGVWAGVTLCCLAGVALVALGLFSHWFPPNDINLQSGLLVSGLTLGAAVAILQALWHDSAQARRILMSVLFLLQATDLSRYFVDVSAIDREFTRQRFKLPTHLPSGTQWALRHPWRRPDLAKGFDGGLPGYMPFANDLWPGNNFLLASHLLELYQIDVPWNSALGQPGVSFHRQAEFVEDQEELRDWVVRNSRRLAESLVVHGPEPARASKRADYSTGSAEETFHFQFSRWQYNEFAFAVEVPEDGWLYVRQLHDPLWRWTVDGEPIRAERANCAGTALPVRSGHHVIEMSYRPLARRLYQPASALLQSVLGLLLVGWLIASRRQTGTSGKRGKESLILLQRVMVHSGCSRIGLPVKLSRP